MTKKDPHWDYVIKDGATGRFRCIFCDFLFPVSLNITKLRHHLKKTKGQGVVICTYEGQYDAPPALALPPPPPSDVPPPPPPDVAPPPPASPITQLLTQDFQWDPPQEFQWDPPQVEDQIFTGVPLPLPPPSVPSNQREDQDEIEDAKLMLARIQQLFLVKKKATCELLLGQEETIKEKFISTTDRLSSLDNQQPIDCDYLKEIIMGIREIIFEEDNTTQKRLLDEAETIQLQLRKISSFIESNSRGL